MEFERDNALALLGRTPGVLDSLLRGLPEDWIACDEGPETWTAHDVVAHLVYTDHANWMPRLRLILASGEAEPFPAFNRFGHLEEKRGRPLDQLLEEFRRNRAQNLAEVRALDLNPDDLAKRGRHPALGPATLAQLVAAWTAHDLTHLHQLTRLLANQYREAVGPWEKFLGVLQCSGHSARS
jgi:DinB family protein